MRGCEHQRARRRRPLALSARPGLQKGAVFLREHEHVAVLRGVGVRRVRLLLRSAERRRELDYSRQVHDLHGAH